MKQKQGDRELTTILRLIHRKTLYYTAMSGETVLNAGFQIVSAFVVKDTINAAVSGEINLLFRAITIFLGMIVCMLVLNPLVFYVFKKSTLETTGMLKLRMFKHLVRLPMSFFDRNHSGDIMTRLSSDIESTADIYTNTVKQMYFTTFFGVVSAALMLNLNWQMAVVLIVMGSLTSFINYRFSKQFRGLSDELHANGGLFTERIVELIKGIVTVKLFDPQRLIVKQSLDVNDSLHDSTLKMSTKSAWLESLNHLMYYINFAGILTLGALLVKQEKVDFGTILAVLILQNGVNAMFLSLARLVVQMQSSLAGASRVFQVLNHTTEANQESGFPFHHIEEAAGEPKAIKIEKLNFHYQDGMNVLKNISLTVPTGSTAALVGYSGNGKSTLIKLLLGFYQPQEGYIQIGNRVLSPETLTECRSDIAYVSQESFMFEGTIEENIRYGRLDATKEEIILAAKAANAHAFIVQMENGYETEIGENASRLSGGQKQRIAIARAILKDAPILLLDEATSALDAESESLIQSSLQTLMEGRTSLVIAHRLTTIENANRIYVLDDGQIIQEGTHGHLMEQADVYKSLFENSFGEAQTRVPMS